MTLSANATYQRPHWVWLAVLALALSVLLGACGFKPKQSHNLPFNTLYTNVEVNSSFGAQLQRILSANSPSLRLTQTPESAEVQLLQLAYNRHLRELSLDPNGQVENYELQLLMEFTLIDTQGNTLMAPATLSVIRDMPNNPDNSYAKQIEIDTLFNDMELSLVDRLVRRLSSMDVQQAYENSLVIDTERQLPVVQPPASAISVE